MRYTLLISFLLCLVSPLLAQSGKGDEPWSVNEATLIGAGGYNLEDTYLTPGKNVNYSGWGLRILNERMRMVSLANHNVSRQQMLNIDVATTDNPAESATDFAGFIDYSLGYHYRFHPLPRLKILTGASARGMAGFIYNTRNGNNPASAKVDVDLNLSALAIYGMRIKNNPLTLRYQLELPVMGVMFSPHFGQSYYEIFNLGNYDGIIRFNSFHNKFAIKNYLTADFSVGNFTLRAGYLHSYYYTDVNDIQFHIRSHTFMIGLVKEFISFGGKRLKEKERYKSAYY
ncbi:DUF3316 domain-containing protein [Parabacteroides sp. OttesenSCG-928-G06]|nr:DUF3316 domain-containing protein [Parabacteroides sp. OttesenSCG-928-G06]